MGDKRMPETFKQVIKRLLSEGWVLDRVKGSHHVFKHPEKGSIVLAVHKGSKDMGPKTYNDISKKAGWK